MHTARRLALTATLLIAGGSAGCAAHGPDGGADQAAHRSPVTPSPLHESRVGPGSGDLLGVALFGMQHDAELRQIAAYRLLTDRRLASAGTPAD